jgi:hypothetical protein
MEVVCSSENLVYTYKSTRCQNRESRRSFIYRLENLKYFHSSLICWQ